MMFLAATALYGLSLSDAAKPIFLEAAALADRAAFDAGFRVEDLALSGVNNAPQAAIFKALELPYEGSSLFYRTAQAHDDLLKLGWVESANVRRILPSRLEVTVTERVPFARWEDASHRVHVIDREGRVLGSGADERFKALPLFAGESAPEQALAFEDALEGRKALHRQIERAELIAERFWIVRLEGGLALKLPRKVTQLALERLDALLANPKIAEMGLETIDLRLTNRTILQLREPSGASRDRAIALLSPAPAQTGPAPRKGRTS
jgi:cell division protein FtsQ